MRRISVSLIAGMVVAGALLGAVGPAVALPGIVVTRASVANDGAQANGSSFDPALSADGRFVAFVSWATNLGGGCAGDYQIYVHDRVTGTTSCVTVRSGGVPADGPSFLPALSADGRIVAFQSTATNLGGGCGGGSQIYVHDRVTGATTCASVESAGSPGNGTSGGAALSADG